MLIRLFHFLSINEKSFAREKYTLDESTACQSNIITFYFILERDVIVLS